MNNLENPCILGRPEHSWNVLSWPVKDSLNYYGITQCQFCFLEKVEPIKYKVQKATYAPGQTCQLCDKMFLEST